MSHVIRAAAPAAGEGALRFVPGRLSNGHFGVFDAVLELYVLRNAAASLAEAVADRLNHPGVWAPSGAGDVAEAVRQALKTTPQGPASHIH